MEDNKMLTNLDPDKNKKKERITVYLTQDQRSWLKKLVKINNFKTQSTFLSALLDREIELYKEEK